MVIRRAVVAMFILIFWVNNLYALPTFSRQTGKNCATCHLNVGELTPAGRQFKLMGYSDGDYVVPLSVIGVLSDTKIQSSSSSINPSVTMPQNGSVIPELVSLFTAGKFYKELGGYVKVSFNNANTSPLFNSQGVQTGTKVGGDYLLDASEIRYTKRLSVGGRYVVAGVTLNNAPAIQDLWPTTPVNNYPYRTSSLLNAWGIGQFGPTTMIDGGLNSQVAGVGIYTMVDDTLYVELAGYTKYLSPLPAISVDGPVNTVSSSVNPYWRLVYNSTRNSDSFMLGTFGMITKLKRDRNISGSSGGNYTDIGLDFDFQHITDVSSWSMQMTYITEHINWNPLAVVRMSHDTTHSQLNTFKAKATYDYKRQLGTNIFVFNSNGSTDNDYWSFNPDQTVVTGACNQNNSQLAFCSANGNPKTSGYGFELYYVPVPYVHIALQQTFYNSFLGGSTFIDNSSGNIRAAKDNNLTYLYAVFSY